MLAHVGTRWSSFGSRTSRTRGIPRGGALTAIVAIYVGAVEAGHCWLTLPAHVENTLNVRTWAMSV